LSFIFCDMLNEKLRKNCETCVVAWKNFKNLSVEELRLVDENRCEASFKRGEVILKQGSPASNAVFLASGLAKIFMDGHDHKSHIIEIALPSRMIVGPGVLVHARNMYTVTALTPVQACFISLEVIARINRQNAEFAAGMLQDLSDKAQDDHNRFVSVTQKKMPGRLAEALLFFSNKVYRSDEFDLVLSRQELGEFTDMAKESVVRILSELESMEVIKAIGSKIIILDRERLKLISTQGWQE